MYRLTMEPHANTTTLRGWSEDYETLAEAESALIEYVCDRGGNLEYETEDSIRQYVADNDGETTDYTRAAWGSDLLTDHRVIMYEDQVRWRPGWEFCDCGDYTLRTEELA